MYYNIDFDSVPFIFRYKWFLIDLKHPWPKFPSCGMVVMSSLLSHFWIFTTCILQDTNNLPKLSFLMYILVNFICALWLINFLFFPVVLFSYYDLCLILSSHTQHTSYTPILASHIQLTSHLIQTTRLHTHWSVLMVGDIITLWRHKLWHHLIDSLSTSS